MMMSSGLGTASSGRGTNSGNIKEKCPQKENNSACANEADTVEEENEEEIEMEEMDEKERELAEAREDFDYSAFACDVLNRAVTVVLNMGYNVDWGRVTRFLMHNHAMQVNPNAVHNPDDAVTLLMTSKMKQMFLSMVRRRRRGERYELFPDLF